MTQNTNAQCWKCCSTLYNQTANLETKTNISSSNPHHYYKYQNTANTSNTSNTSTNIAATNKASCHNNGNSKNSNNNTNTSSDISNINNNSINNSSSNSSSNIDQSPKPAKNSIKNPITTIAEIKKLGFCNACGSITEINTQNYFALFGIKNPTLHINLHEIQKIYLIKIKQMHPDRFIAQNLQKESEIASINSALYSSAFQTLSNIESRLEYYFKTLQYNFDQKRIKEEFEASPDYQAMLLESIEWQESILEQQNIDPETIKKIKKEFHDKIKIQLEQIMQYSKKKENLDKAFAEYIKFKFLKRFIKNFNNMQKI